MQFRSAPCYSEIVYVYFNNSHRQNAQRETSKNLTARGACTTIDWKIKAIYITENLRLENHNKFACSKYNSLCIIAVMLFVQTLSAISLLDSITDA